MFYVMITVDLASLSLGYTFQLNEEKLGSTFKKQCYNGPNLSSFPDSNQ